MAKTTKKMPRGSVELTDSNGDRYVLKFGTNAMCRIQDSLGKTLGEILEDLKDEQKLDIKMIRTMVQMAMVTDQEVTAEAVGDLIDDVGLQAITKVFGSVFSEKAEGNDRPRQGQPGDVDSASPLPN